MILYIGWLFDAKCVCITVRLQAQLQRCRVCVEYKFGCIVLFWYVVLFFTFATVRMHCVFVRWMNVLQPFCIYVYYILCTIVSCTIVLCSLSSSLLPFFIQWLPFNFYLFFFIFPCVSQHGSKISNGKKITIAFSWALKWFIWITRKMSKWTEIWSIFYIISK